MNRLFSLFFLCVLVLVVCENSQAGTEQPVETVTLPVTIVTASRIPTTIEDIPGNTILDRQAIEEIRPASVVDLLRRIPGLHIDQKGGRGGISSIYLRGSDPNFTLVMIDGVKVNDPTNMRGGSFDFSTLNVDNIERIEIIRGPLSAVYGSDALAGAINIITRKGTRQPEYAIGFDFGQNRYYQAHTEARGPLGKTSNYVLFASTVDSGDIVEHSEFAGSSLGGKLNIHPTDNLKIKWTMLYNKGQNESFPDDSGGSKYALIRETEKRDTEDFSLDLLLSGNLFSWADLNFKGSFYSREEDSTSPGVAPGIRDPFGIPPIRSNTRFNRTILEVSSLMSLSDLGWISIGAEAQFEKGDSDSVIMFFGIPVPNNFDLDRQSASAFLEARLLTPFGIIFNTGLRVDVPEESDTEISPHVAVVYKIPSTTTWKASWGKGFKLPSFFALGSPIVGNPDLLPETSKSFEIGVSHEIFDGRLTLSANAFDNRFFDVIDFEEGPPPKLVNRSEVTATGFEGGVGLWIDDNLSVNAHLSYVDTDIKGTTEALRNRPEWRGDLNLRWQPVPKAVLRLNVLYVDKVFDSSIPTGDVTLDDYTRVDISGVWKIQPNLQIGLHLDNLFDADYEEYVGFVSPGFQLRASLLYRF